MAKHTVVEGWTPTEQQRKALEQGLVTIAQARKQLQAIRACDPEFADKHEAWAEAMEQSFHYFLSSPSIHPAYVFTAEITEPEALVYQIHQLMKLFDIPETAY